MVRAIEVLLVEDNPGDAGLLRESFKGVKTRVNLTVVQDGQQAMEHLQQTLLGQSLARPDLVLLDLNLPKRDGREVLRSIKTDERFQTIPVIIFTSSRNPADVAVCYKLHANAYIVKPSELRAFLEVAVAIEHFWFTTVVPFQAH